MNNYWIVLILCLLISTPCDNVGGDISEFAPLGARLTLLTIRSSRVRAEERATMMNKRTGYKVVTGFAALIFCLASLLIAVPSGWAAEELSGPSASQQQDVPDNPQTQPGGDPGEENHGTDVPTPGTPGDDPSGNAGGSSSGGSNGAGSGSASSGNSGTGQQTVEDKPQVPKPAPSAPSSEAPRNPSSSTPRHFLPWAPQKFVPPVPRKSNNAPAWRSWRTARAPQKTYAGSTGSNGAYKQSNQLANTGVSINLIIVMSVAFAAGAAILSRIRRSYKVK